MSAIDELELLMQECNTDVIAVIANRLKSMDGLTRTDAIYLSNLAHTEDLNKITDILSKTAEKSKIEVNKAIEEASKENDELAEQFYKAKNLDTTVRSDVLKGIQKRAEKSMIDDILNLSHTAGFYIDGKPTSITKTYTNMINKGIYATQQGTMTYQQAIRNSIKQLADSGLRVVDFESGYSRRLDTQVRMNVLDGVRQMNMEYSTQQGKEFGADGVEVSAHGLCAKDHQMIQGRQYSIDKFKRLNNRLDRAIGTCNCYHRTYPIILGISQPAYSNEELREIDRKSNEMVTYTDKFGEEHQCSRYDATQLQRRQETLLRKLKDERNAYQTAGNDAMVKELDRKIKLQTQYYKDVSAEVGLKPRMDRARVVNPHKSATKEVPKVEKFVKEKKVDVKDLPQNMQDFIYKYTDGEYSDVCEYSQYLMTGTSKKLSLTTKPEQWEKKRNEFFNKKNV